MKTVERIMMKLIIIHVLFLCATQVFLKVEDRMIHLSKLSQYEGVNKNTDTNMMETMKILLE